MLLFGLTLALGLTLLLGGGSAAFRRRVVVTIRPGTQSLSLRAGQRLLLVNGDIRPHRLVEPQVRLERPGAAGMVRFPARGDYVLHTDAGPSLVPWLADAPGAGATLRVSVR